MPSKSGSKHANFSLKWGGGKAREGTERDKRMHPSGA